LGLGAAEDDEEDAGVADEEEEETLRVLKKDVNFSPTRLAPVSSEVHAAFAPSRSCSPVRSMLVSSPLLVLYSNR
jgi:hypothetical protein